MSEFYKSGNFALSFYGAFWITANITTTSYMMFSFLQILNPLGYSHYSGIDLTAPELADDELEDLEPFIKTSFYFMGWVEMIWELSLLLVVNLFGLIASIIFVSFGNSIFSTLSDFYLVLVSFIMPMILSLGWVAQLSGIYSFSLLTRIF